MGGLELPETGFSRLIDGIIRPIGRAASWLWVVLLLVIVGNVALRYVFGEGRVELEELQWHINSVAFLIAVAYAYQTDSHIRIDLVSSKMTPRSQAWVELYGTLLLLLPFAGAVTYFALPFVAHSWSVNEVSQSPGGLPYRWFLKAVLPGALILLLLGIAARVHRLWVFLAQEPASDRHVARTPTGSGANSDFSVGHPVESSQAAEEKRT